MKNKMGKFRFTYFTDKYEETCDFYQNKLELNLEHSWDRSDQDKGSLFVAGQGLIEVMLSPTDKEHNVKGLDYRVPQGVFMCIQVWKIDELYEKYKAKGIPFKEEVTDQSWGHRSFSIIDPNGIVIFFFQELY